MLFDADVHYTWRPWRFLQRWFRMTTYRRIVRVKNGVMLSKEVRGGEADVIIRYFVISHKTPNASVFGTLEEAEAFFCEEAACLQEKGPDV